MIKKQQNTIKDLQNKLYNINTNQNNYNNFQTYQNIINQKEEELNKLKLKLKNSHNRQYVDINKLIAINFILSNNKINVPVPCIDTNTFAEVEERLYQKYPEYRETNNNFLVNGKQILRFKTIKQNQIRDGLSVTMVMP